mgnify:CR=1 FL=1
MDLLIFSELVTSNNFLLLLNHYFSLFIPYHGLGVYMQGLPTANVLDFFWGTNAGLRTLPLLFSLSILQYIFHQNWSTAYLIISIVLPFITFLIACRFLGKFSLFTFIGAIFYGGNLWIINRIFTGFWQLNLSYAFLPFLIVVPLRLVSTKVRLTELLFLVCIYSIAASFVLTSQPHFLIFTTIFAVFHFIKYCISKNIALLRILLIFYLSSAFVFFCLNAYFFIPGIFFPEKLFTAPNQYFSIGSVIFNGQGNLIEHVLRFEPLGQSSLNFIWTWINFLQFIPILLFLIIFLINKNRQYIYLVLVLLFIFFAKGLNEPFSDFSKWIYQNIFFMHYFRDPARFLAGVALFSSFSIATFHIKKKLPKKLQLLILTGVVLLFITINTSSFYPPKTDIFKSTNVPKEYLDLQKFIANDPSIDAQQRLLILPNRHGLLGYHWYTNPSPNTSNTIFDAILPLKIPLANSTNYPDNYSNQFSSYIYEEYTKTYDEKLLIPLGVKYVLVDESIIKPQLEKDIATSSAMALLSNSAYQRVFYEKPLSLFRVNTQATLFNDQKPIFAIGNLATITNQYASGMERPIILLNQPINKDLIKSSSLKGKDILIDTKDPLLTITAESIAENYFVDILKAGWDYDKIFGNYEPYKMKSVINKGQLFTSGRAVISLPKSGFMHVDHSLQPGTYRILIKTLSEFGNAGIELTAGNKKTIQVNTNNQLSWIDAGVIKIDTKQSYITLTKTDSNPLIIDYLIFVPEANWNTSKNSINQILKSMTTYHPNKIQKSTAQFNLHDRDIIDLDKDSPYVTTHISYSNYWKSNTPSETFMSDAYAMTFIAKDKNIKNIEYYPNKIFKVLSLVTLTICIVVVSYCCYFIIKRLKKVYSSR